MAVYNNNLEWFGSSQGLSPLLRAIERAEVLCRAGIKASVFGFEVGGKNSGRKNAFRYAVASWDDFISHYSGLAPERRLFHEVFLSDQICALLPVDIDCDLSLNPGLTHALADQYILEPTISAVLHALKSRFGLESERVDVRVLQAHGQFKYSAHILFAIDNGEIGWPTIMHCGAFVNDISRAHRTASDIVLDLNNESSTSDAPTGSLDKPQCLPLVHAADGRIICAVDTNIYANKHCFRMYGSGKVDEYTRQMLLPHEAERAVLSGPPRRIDAHVLQKTLVRYAGWRCKQQLFEHLLPKRTFVVDPSNATRHRDQEPPKPVDQQQLAKTKAKHEQRRRDVYLTSNGPSSGAHRGSVRGQFDVVLSCVPSNEQVLSKLAHEQSKNIIKLSSTIIEAALRDDVVDKLLYGAKVLIDEAKIRVQTRRKACILLGSNAAHKNNNSSWEIDLCTQTAHRRCFSARCGNAVQDVSHFSDSVVIREHMTALLMMLSECGTLRGCVESLDALISPNILLDALL